MNVARLTLAAGAGDRRRASLKRFAGFGEGPDKRHVV
jgi:hypothetical protein